MDILTSGIYDVPIADYHGKEICPGPSISSSGLKVIARCPYKYWFNSPLNPHRPPESNAPHFAIGRAAHDLVLDGVGWPDRYHVTPQGFTRAGTRKFAAEIEAVDAAEAMGKTVLRHEDYVTVTGMADAIKRHPIHKALGRGKAEQTIVWQDDETRVWLRCRPDFLPDDRKYIPDYKTCVSAHPDDFARDVRNYGYHQQAALYLDGLESVFGIEERVFYFIAQEKEPPYIVQPFALDADALAWGRKLNRLAIRTFARCLDSGIWPGYSADFLTVKLPTWEIDRLNNTYTGFPQ